MTHTGQMVQHSGMTKEHNKTTAYSALNYAFDRANIILILLSLSLKIFCFVVSLVLKVIGDSLTIMCRSGVENI